MNQEILTRFREIARNHFFSRNWEPLTATGRQRGFLSHKPIDRQLLTAIGGCSLDDFPEVGNIIRESSQTGLPQEQIQQLLLVGILATLARNAILVGKEETAFLYLNEAINLLRANYFPNYLLGILDELRGMFSRQAESVRLDCIDKKVCFVHIPKTAGKSVNKALYGERFGWDSLAYHARISDHRLKNNPYKFCVIRNPLTFYVSIYHFFREQMNNIKNPLRYIASDVEFNVFLEIITDCGLFKQYLDAKKIKLWGRDRKFALAQNPEIGLLTFYFLYMCFNNNQMAILSPCKVFQLYPSQFSLDAVLRFESLERDFPALMSEWNIPVLPLEQLNASKHDEWSRYYTKETKNIVLKKDWLIFKLFYPEFLKSCGLYSW